MVKKAISRTTDLVLAVCLFGVQAFIALGGVERHLPGLA
jgi:hypothetical protein